MSEEEKKTVEFAAPPEWAVKMSERMVSEFQKTNANIALVSGEVVVVKERLAVVEDWKRKQESMPPPPPITSERVKAIVDGHTSQPDLKLAAQQADIIAKIAETHALAQNAATKEDMQKLAEGTATKAEVKEIAADQTHDIVSSVEGLAQRNKTVRMLLIALAGLAFLAINAATNYLTRHVTAPQQPPALMVPK
jgi:hypothetical protein